MGSGSERMLEKQREGYDKHLAKLLGITYDELLELNYNEYDDSSKDGLVYRCIFEFPNDDNPKEILDKIKDLDSNNCIYFLPTDLTVNPEE